MAKPRGRTDSPPFPPGPPREAAADSSQAQHGDEPSETRVAVSQSDSVSAVVIINIGAFISMAF